MSVRGVDVDRAFDDPEDGWFGRAEIVEPEFEARAAVDERVPTDDPGTDTWHVPVAAADPAVRVDDRRVGFVAAPRPGSWESRISDSRAWDFKPPSGDPWYRSKYAALVAVVAAAVLIAGIVLLVREPAATVDDSTRVAPSASTGRPAPTTPAPAVSTQADVPLSPPEPEPEPVSVPEPVPPPPSAEEMTPPVVDREYAPSRRTSDEPKKPQTNVTRVPMSATPPPPPKPDRNSSTPGDGRKRGGFGW